MTEQKKNKPQFIIPATFFRKIKGPVPKKENQPAIVNNQPETTSVVKEAVSSMTDVNRPNEIKTTVKKSTSGLSLKSIKAKRDHKIRQMDVVLQAEDLPKEPFSENDFKLYWSKYNKQLDQKGLKIVSSIMQSVIPKLEDTTIHIEFPNESMKIDLEREQNGLMEFLRRNLKNYDLSLKITVNEEITSKQAFTDEEKLAKLIEKNPALKLLKDSFSLEF